MKNVLISLLFILALSVPAFAGTAIDLETPIDVTAYCGGGYAAKIDLLSINYDTGEVRFKLLAADGSTLGNGAVFGITLPAPVDQDAVRAAVIAEIAKKTEEKNT